MRYRIAAAQLSHETNVFSSVRTDLAAFQRAGLTYGPAILERERSTNSAFGGFITGAGQHGFELVPILSVWATPAGVVAGDALCTLVAELCDGLRTSSVDGVLLGLHGAMVSELDPDADAYILERIRALVGPNVPVIATLDLHANISQRLVDAVTMLIGYDTYPHVDMAERAAEAADLMLRILDEEVHPVSALVKPPMLPTSQNMTTDREPMRSLLALAHELERDPRVLNVTVAGGFPAADVPECGISVLVTTNNNPALAQELAQRLAHEAWARREAFLGGVTSFDEAATIVHSAMDAASNAVGAIRCDRPAPTRAAEPFQTDLTKPLVLVDIGDNPWSGSPGDSAELLRFLLAEGVRDAVLALIVDPEAVQTGVAACVGATIEVVLGGKTDRLHGDPLPVRGYVRLVSDGRYVNAGPMMAGLPVDLGPSLVLVCGDGGIEVLVTSRAETPIDLNVFRAAGIEPMRKRVIGLKGKGHFRAAFEPIAERVVLVEGPGISGSDLSRLPFKNIRRPIWPLDQGVTYGHG